MKGMKIYMAPLQGITEAPFRNLFSRYFGGVDAYYTPFVRWEYGAVRKKDMRDLEPERNTVDMLVPQLIAGSPEEAEKIMPEILKFGYRRVDLNMGCAFPALAKKGKGCGLMPHPEKVRELLALTARYPEVEFSVKMRLGYENAQECMELLSLLNDARLARIVVHARIGKQQYKGGCDREAFARFAEGCRHALVYNGDIMTVGDIMDLQRDFPQLDGVMIGRGLLAQPWMAAEYVSQEVWSQADRMQAMRRFHSDLFAHYEQALEGGEKQLLMKMKGFWEYLFVDGDRKMRKKIHKAQKTVDYTNAVFQLLQ